MSVKLSFSRRASRTVSLAAAILSILSGGCLHRMHGQTGGQDVPPDAWAKPDRYWSERFRTRAADAAPGGRTFYASPTGSDDHPGDSGRPWRTLQRASVAMEPGDTLLVADGEYPGGLKQTVSGAPGRPITYRAVNPGMAIIRGDQAGPVYRARGRGNSRSQIPNPRSEISRDALFITGASDIVIEGLVVHHAPRAGIRIDQANRVTVRWCRFMQNGTWGIFTDYSDDLRLEHNECAYSDKQHGIYVSNSGDRPVLRFNSCHNNTRAGIQLNGDAKQRKPELGTRGDGIIEGAVIEGNTLYENGKGGAAGLNLACVRGARIVNNLIFHNRAGGIALFNDHRRDMVEFGSKNNRIVHNTIVFRPRQGRFCISLKHGSTDNVIRNNVLSGGRFGAYEFDDTSSFTADYNVLWSADQGPLASNEDTGANHTAADWKRLGKNDVRSVWADPRLDKDFRPLPTSPAFGRASEEPGITSDALGRPRAAKRNIGALEGGK